MRKLTSYIIGSCLLAILVNYAVKLLADICLELMVGSLLALGFYITIIFIKHHQDWR